MHYTHIMPTQYHTPTPCIYTTHTPTTTHHTFIAHTLHGLRNLTHHTYTHTPCMHHGYTHNTHTPYTHTPYTHQAYTHHTPTPCIHTTHTTTTAHHTPSITIIASTCCTQAHTLLPIRQHCKKTRYAHSSVKGGEGGDMATSFMYLILTIFTQPCRERL